MYVRGIEYRFYCIKNELIVMQCIQIVDSKIAGNKSDYVRLTHYTYKYNSESFGGSN